MFTIGHARQNFILTLAFKNDTELVTQHFLQLVWLFSVSK